MGRVGFWNMLLTLPVMRVAAMKSRKEERMFGSLSCIWCQSVVSGLGCRSHACA